MRSFKFFDSRILAKKAHEQGVRIRVYANQPSIGIINKLLTYEAELYIGETKAKDHYLVVDGNSWIHSEENPLGQIGLRKDMFIKTIQRERVELSNYLTI